MPGRCEEFGEGRQWPVEWGADVGSWWGSKQHRFLGKTGGRGGGVGVGRVHTADAAEAEGTGEGRTCGGWRCPSGGRGGADRGCWSHLLAESEGQGDLEREGTAAKEEERRRRLRGTWAEPPRKGGEFKLVFQLI